MVHHLKKFQAEKKFTFVQMNHIFFTINKLSNYSLHKLSIAITLFSTFGSYGQTPKELSYHPAQWQQATGIQSANAGGYVMVSNSIDSAGKHSILITKFDNELHVIWERKINELNSLISSSGFFQDALGNIYIGGFKNGSSYLTMKTDSLGNLIWSSCYSIPNVTPHNFSGNVSQGFYFMATKADTLGDTILVVTCDTSGIFHGAASVYRYNHRSISALNSVLTVNGFGVCFWRIGLNEITGEIQYFIGNSPASGIITTGNFPDLSFYPEMNFVFPTISGDLVIAGNCFSGQGAAPTIQIIDNSGSTSLSKPYDYPGKFINCITTSDGGYAVIGQTLSLVHLIKMDSLLNVEWAYEYPDAQLEYADILLETANTTFLIAGRNPTGQIVIVSTDSLGNSYCNNNSIVVASISGAAGSTPVGSWPSTLFQGANSPVNLQSSSLTGNNLDTVCLFTSSEETIRNLFNIFPSPTNSIINVEANNGKINSITVLNLLGERIYSVSVDNRDLQTINCETFPSGIYFLQAQTEHGIYTAKFIKE
jgi:hypothetical protein